MNKNIKNIIIILLIIFFLLIILPNYYLFSKITLDIGSIYLKKVFPFLFLMMVINNLLLKLNFPYYLSFIIKNPSLYVMILSMISGSPLNAVILDKFLQEKKLNEKQASLILCFTSFNNPLFLYNYFYLIFQDKIIIIKLFLIIYLSNIIIYLFLKKKLNLNNFSFPYEENSFMQSLTSSIKEAILNMINIFATIFCFYLITSTLIKTEGLIPCLTKGLIEITQGLNSISYLNISLKIKELLVLVILQFQGLAIHIQIASILSKYNINYKYFYLSRIFLIIISFLQKMIM